MIQTGFPVDEYTPHGYLANPYAVAHSWSEGEGGCLRTSRDEIGLGWQLPWALRAQASLDLVVRLGNRRARMLRRDHFEGAGLHCPHHSANLLVYRWDWLGRTWEAAYTLVERDVLGLQVSWRPWSDAAAAESAPERTEPEQTRLTIGLVGWRKAIRSSDADLPSASAPGIPGTAPTFEADGWIELGGLYGRCELQVDAGGFKVGGVAIGRPQLDHATQGDEAGEWRATINAAIEVGDTPTGSVSAIARRVVANPHPNPLPEGEGASRGARQAPALRPSPAHGAVVTSAEPMFAPRSGQGPHGREAPESCELRGRVARAGGRGSPGTLVTAAIDRAREADHAFWRGATRLEGDWPASWRRGWVYDTETTRMCIYPPGGIFTDVWAAWMVQWPRAVVAEGTLDMARFAYASPDLAQRALLSLFRDAEAPNVPCVFQHGEPNMVAKDGSICGTSPAWCLPFYNLERLFSFTLDRAWLAAIYPYLARYLEWWLAERTDPSGWAVYKCTWEAGEDDTPRLDPDRRGDNVVSAFVRPVELQAMMALSAGVLARFATVLGESDDVTRWQQVEAEYLDHTRQLWDPAAGRFRDWDARAGQFVAPAPDAPNYWGIDPCRYSALAFTPLLAGLLDDEFRDGLWNEIQQYDGPPWTLWASWSYVILEAARLVRDPGLADRSGAATFAGRVAAGIVGRVYDELDTHHIVDPRHPTPGVAREYWPLDLDTWASCEGYGWGANTASLLVRQVFGLLEGPYLDTATPLTFELRPALPDALRIPGREYWLRNLPYRGMRLSLGYRVADAPPGTDGSFSALEILVSTDVPVRCKVVDTTAPLVRESEGAEDLHEIPARIGGTYIVELRPES